MSKRRISRKERRRRQVERERRMRLLRVWGPIGVVVVGLIIFTIVRFAGQDDIEGVTIVDGATPNQHDADLQIAFGGLPPTGGPHNPTWQNCGIYDVPVAGEYAIHSMEHGAVWLTYHPDLPADQVEQLKSMVRGDAYVLMSPYPDQDANIVLTVWDRQLAVASADDSRIQQFIDRYRRTRGPENAPCSNGIGTPRG